MYDTPLTATQILSALTEQPRAIAAMTSGLSKTRLHRAPDPDQWSVNDVLAHLRSCSDVWGKYIRLIAAGDHPTYRAVNPTKWIESTVYPALEFTTSFKTYRKQRDELVDFLRSLPPKAWSRTALVTGAGSPRDRSLHEYAMWLANHERTHVKQIARLVGSGS